MKPTKPYKGFSVLDVTQGFHNDHRAIDAVPKDKLKYGKPLVAPEKIRIQEVITPDKLTDSNDGLAYGYGIWMLGLETGNRYLYWHCLPIFPVWGGDIIERGKIVAYMGNAGTVYQGGVYVPLEDRSKPHYPGTHLHYSVLVNNKLTDPLVVIDLTTEPTYTFFDEISSMGKVLAKISKLLIRKI